MRSRNCAGLNGRISRSSLCAPEPHFPVISPRHPHRPPCEWGKSCRTYLPRIHPGHLQGPSHQARDWQE
jgi:hypothetical protein